MPCGAEALFALRLYLSITYEFATVRAVHAMSYAAQIKHHCKFGWRGSTNKLCQLLRRVGRQDIARLRQPDRVGDTVHRFEVEAVGVVSTGLL